MAGERAIERAEHLAMIFVRTYGNGIDFGGRRAKRTLLAAAKRCLAKGWLSGDYRCAALTEAGRAHLERDATQEPR